LVDEIADAPVVDQAVEVSGAFASLPPVQIEGVRPGRSGTGLQIVIISEGDVGDATTSCRRHGSSGWRSDRANNGPRRRLGRSRCWPAPAATARRADVDVLSVEKALRSSQPYGHDASRQPLGGRTFGIDQSQVVGRVVEEWC
jgi:hypothetical protein